MLAILRIANLINDTAIINQTLEQILNPVIKWVKLFSDIFYPTSLVLVDGNPLLNFWRIRQRGKK